MPVPAVDDLLVRYGWDDGWVTAAGADVNAAGRITRVDRGECDVVTAAGKQRVISDSTRAQAEVAPAVGDWVVVGHGPEDKPLLMRVLDRRKTLVRRDPAEGFVDQVLVANVDTVMIVHGLDRALPPGRLERFLVQVWDSGATPLVVLTKSDLLASTEDVVATVRAVAPDVEVLATSDRTSDRTSSGIDELRARVPAGQTAALVGASGVGKSSLVNALVGVDVQAIAEVRARDAKGRHTTTARELVLVPGGGAIVDTPGVRAVGVWADETALHEVFADIESLAACCRFTDCAHDREPDCAVRGEVDARRLDRYRALREELRSLTERAARPSRRRG